MLCDDLGGWDGGRKVGGHPKGRICIYSYMQQKQTQICKAPILLLVVVAKIYPTLKFGW